ncbi:hypothetical protein BB561_000056 [Smittium simulii]|uniref:Uncharacterized protein n=1 Tax=Smittium simulii TaxID=133385 RepID=A0A2T9Z0T9_9FUNG|nr:hypothetical protein BB561_000056 [Smittium simulii]
MIFCTFVISNVPGVIPSAAAGVPLIPTKRTRLEYSTQKITKITKKIQKIKKKNEKFEKFQQNNKNNVKKIINPAFTPQEFTEVSIMHLLDNSIPKALKKACYGGSNTKIGCSWTQFSGNINAAIDYVALKIDDEYISYQHDSRAKATYFMFYNEERAEKSNVV